MSLENTKKWFKQAIPEPTIENACVQIGCAYEETAELAKTMCDYQLSRDIYRISMAWKRAGRIEVGQIENLGCNSMIEDRKQMLDDIVDEIVTRVGIAHCMGFDIVGALEEVNRSNFSKFEDGKPVFDENGKITKGKDYVKPNLERFV